MQKTVNKSNVVKLAVVGASLAGIAATAYFFFGPKGKKHRQHAKAWAIKMKGEVIEKLEAGIIPWHKPWQSVEGMPKNLISKKEYRLRFR